MKNSRLAQKFIRHNLSQACSLNTVHWCAGWCRVKTYSENCWPSTPPPLLVARLNCAASSCAITCMAVTLLYPFRGNLQQGMLNTDTDILWWKTIFC